MSENKKSILFFGSVLAILIIAIIYIDFARPGKSQINCRLQENEEKHSLLEYDPNELIYQYIPPAHETWRQQFGDNERTRILHTISELRVSLALLNDRVKKLEAKDPNGKVTGYSGKDIVVEQTKRKDN